MSSHNKAPIALSGNTSHFIHVTKRTLTNYSQHIFLAKKSGQKLKEREWDMKKIVARNLNFVNYSEYAKVKFIPDNSSHSGAIGSENRKQLKSLLRR